MLVETTATVAAARIVCRQAGYPFSNGTRDFGQGSGPLGVDIYRCTGDEERVEHCWHTGWNIELCISPCTDLSVSCRGEYVQRTMYTFESTHVYMYTHTHAHMHAHTHYVWRIDFYTNALFVSCRGEVVYPECELHTHARTLTHTCTRTHTIILIYVSAISYRCGEWSL